MRARVHVVRLLAVLALGAIATSCSDPNKEFDADEEPGTVKGVIRSGTADYFDENRSEKVYAIEKKDGTYVKLEGFSGAPGIRPGSIVRIYGPQKADSIRVDLIKVLDPGSEGLGQAQQRSTANPPALSPPLKNAFVSLSSSYTDTQGKARLTKTDFIKPVMEVSSYGRWTTEWEFYGPYTVANDCGGSFYENIGKNGTAAMKAAGVDPAQFNQIQFYLGNTFTSCSWGGFGLDGHTPLRTDGLRGQYNPWSYVKNDGENVMVQEIGHNWGLAHVHFCPGNVTPTPSCSGYQEYGSPYTPMANGNNVYLNAWERIQMNFLSGCNVLTVATNGSYEIGPLTQACDGPQVLRFAADLSGSVQRYWYLEYRVPTGIETSNGVLLHYSADLKNGGWTRCDWGGPDCPEDWVVNPMPSGTASQALLKAGTMWSTPEGVTVNIASLGTTAKFDLTFPMQGAAPKCDLADMAWDNKAPVCTPGGGVGDAGPPTDGGGTGGAGGSDGGGGSAGAGGAIDAGQDVGTADATGGRGGSAGMGGASGSGGAAGATGGRGGSAGGAGRAGSGGAAGTAGGSSGAAGASGTGGSSGAAGNAGQAGTGATGGSGITGGSGGAGGDTPDESDCACRVPGGARSSDVASPFAILATLGALARRRRRSRSA